MTEPAQPPYRPPVPLVVAAVVTAFEGLGLLVYGVVQAFAISSDRIVMGVTDAGFFGLYGGFLVFAALKLTRGHSWAWAPVMLAQLLQIAVGMTWGNTTVAAVALVPGVIVGVALLMPTSIRALLDNLNSRWTVEDTPGEELGKKSGSPDSPDSPTR